MDMHRHPLDETFGEEGAGQGYRADQKRKGDHLSRDDTGEAKHRNLDHTGDDRNHRVGRNDGSTFKT